MRILLEFVDMFFLASFNCYINLANYCSIIKLTYQQWMWRSARQERIWRKLIILALWPLEAKNEQAHCKIYVSNDVVTRGQYIILNQYSSKYRLLRIGVRFTSSSIRFKVSTSCSGIISLSSATKQYPAMSNKPMARNTR